MDQKMVHENLELRLRKVKELQKVLATDGNWDFDSQMLGMYNGFEFAVAVMEGRIPRLRIAPKKWVSEREFYQKALDLVDEI